MSDESRCCLRMEGITKIFSGVTALDGVDFELSRGARSHALVGENGAGKSTLIKIMTGRLQARRRARCGSKGARSISARRRRRRRAGVVAVYQEVNLLVTARWPRIIFLGREPRRLGLVDWKRMNARRRTPCSRASAWTIDPRAALGSLNIALRQMVAIARGVSLGAKVVVLDEPTSSLTEREVAILYDVIRRLKVRGRGASSTSATASTSCTRCAIA